MVRDKSFNSFSRVVTLSIFNQSSQRRIRDDFSRDVAEGRNCENYQKALYQIQRNSSSRSLSRRLTEEQKERDFEECLRKVSFNVLVKHITRTEFYRHKKISQ